MIVTSSGVVIAGNRIIINDVVNEFLGTVSNLWSNPANWSLGVVPAANHIAIIKNNVILDTNSMVRMLTVPSIYTVTGDNFPRSLAINEECRIDGNIDLSGAAHNLVLNGAVLIKEDTTVSMLNGLIVTINNSLNGANSNSIIDNKGDLRILSSQAPMLTGQLLTDNAANTVRYNRAGNQDVKGGTYRTLEFGGSGVKKLLGNVVVNTTAGGSWSITGSATIDYNGFTITTI